MSADFPTDAERCAVVNVRELTAGLAFGLPPDVEQYVVRDAILTALAPLIRAREAAARRAGAVEVLRAAADGWTHGQWANDLPPQGASRPQLILGMAQRAGDWLRARADQIERGESS